MSYRTILYIGLAVSVGALAKLTFEYFHYRTWDNLEKEVDEWRLSPKGRFNAYLDGLSETP